MSADVSIASLIAVGLLAVAGVACAVAAIRTHLPWRRWRVAAMLAIRLALLAMLAAWAMDVRLTLPRLGSGHDPVELVIVADRSESISSVGRKALDTRIAEIRDVVGPQRTVTVVDFGADGGSDLAGAIAAASFTGSGVRAVLICSDGRPTTGDPLAAVQRLINAGATVYAAPVEPLAGESLIADLIVPAAVWRDVPTPVEAVVRSATAGPATLTLLIDGTVADERELQLPAGVSSVTLPATIAAEGVHRVEVRAVFARDSLTANNTSAALVDVPLAPRVVILSNSPGSAVLKKALTANGMQVRIVKPADLAGDLACDCIVLDNVPAVDVSPDAQKAIEAFVADGGALVTSGGGKAYAAGGWRDSTLDPVFAVHLDPKKEQVPFALMIVLDNSWSMNEGLTNAVGKIDIAKEIAIAAMDGLSPGDFLALVSFDSDYHNIIEPTKVKDLEPARYEVSRIGAFGMTNILGGLQEAARILPQIDSPYKHVLLSSDGRETETGTDYSRCVQRMVDRKITLSAISVGLAPNVKLMNTLAYAGKGRHYHTKSYDQIPAVVLREARSMDDQLLVDLALTARQVNDDPAIDGIDVTKLPALGGFNRSRARRHAWTPLVISSKNEPLLARMRYGSGQSLAFTSAATGSWATDWIEQAPTEYIAFWRQAIASVLGPPHRELPLSVSFPAGRPVLNVDAPTDAKVYRLAGEKIIEVAATASRHSLAAGSSRAMLVTTGGKALRAAAWKRTAGAEFDAPARGLAMLRAISEAAGTTFDPTTEDILTSTKAFAGRPLTPPFWLAAAAVLLIIELLLRRLPALTRLASPQRESSS